MSSSSDNAVVAGLEHHCRGQDMRQPRDCVHFGAHGTLGWLLQDHDQLAFRVATANLSVAKSQNGVRHRFEMLRPGADNQADDLDPALLSDMLRTLCFPLPTNEITA